MAKPPGKRLTAAERKAKAARGPVKPGPKKGTQYDVKPREDRAGPLTSEKGAPTLYRQEYVQTAKTLCELGATTYDVAQALGVSHSTIKRWAVTHPDFCASLKVGKEPADDRVEHSLFMRATGYTFDSEKVFQHRGKIIRTKIKEHVPPDPTAMIYWTSNRRPEKWKRSRNVNEGFDETPPPVQINVSVVDASKRSKKESK